MSDQNMSPDASPGALKSGTRHVNNMPLVIIGAIVIVFLLVMVAVGIQRAAKQNAPVDVQKPKAGSTLALANAVMAGQPEGVIPPRTDQPPKIPSLDIASSSATAAAAPAGGAVGIVRPNLELPPQPPGRQLGYAPGNANGNAGMGMPDSGMSERIRQVKEQMFIDAVKARPTVQFDTGRSSGNSGSAALPAVSADAPLSRNDMLDRLAAVRRQLANAGTNDPTAAYKAQLAQIQSSGLIPTGAGVAAGGAGGNPLAMLANATQNRGANVSPSTAQSGDRFRLNSEPQAPESAFELRAPSLIPATLISGINSELKGPVIAQVSRDVWDTATHKYLLIPQGSKLYGEYDSQVAYGQSRVLMAWSRIVYPDGKAQDIGSMPGVDASGYAGFNDQVNNHYVRLFASAILLSGVTAGVSLSTNGNQTSSVYGQQQTASQAMSQALGQQLGQVTGQLLSKNMNIAPTLEIRPGYRFNIVIVKDMVFSKPYQAYDY
jgi:type IV secretion system protein VirB10